MKRFLLVGLIIFSLVLFTGCQKHEIKSELPDIKPTLAEMFSKFLNKRIVEDDIIIEDQTKIHVRGRVKVDGEEKFFLASSAFQEWEIVIYGDQIYSCTAIQMYKFPYRFIKDCYFDETSKVLMSILKLTHIKFEDLEKNIDIIWRTKDGEKKLIANRIKAMSVPSEKIAQIKEYFDKQNFQVDQYNVAEGTVFSVSGYRLDKIVCLMSVENQAADDPHSALNVQISCAELPEKK